MSERPSDAAAAPFGLLVVDKPAGMTSHDVVDRVRRVTRTRKVGHTGTLDPAATGVLVLCLGRATRLAEALKADEKAYRGTVRFGAATTTYDAEGETTATGEVRFDRDALETALASFRGPIEQRPPAWSALKRGGERVLDKARRGEEVVLEPRPVTIHALTLADWTPPEARLDVRCSAGTYVRSLAHDLGAALACPAHLAALRRTACGAFSIDEALPLDALVDAGPAWREHLRPVGDGLPADWPRVTLDAAGARALAHGHAVPLPDDAPAADVLQVVAQDGRFLALGTASAEPRELRPTKVFVRPEECEA